MCAAGVEWVDVEVLLRSSQKNGADLENDLERYHRTLPGWIVIRQSPPFVRTPSGWKPKPPGGPPDFYAWNREVGPVLFDAKSRVEDEWEVSLLEPHQHALLKKMHACGGTAGIYLRLTTGDVWVRFPVLTAAWSAWFQDRKRRTLTARDGIAVDGCDWVSVVRLLGREAA